MSWRLEPGMPFWSRPCTAANLERVVAVGQSRTASGATVALTALECYGAAG